MNRNSEIAAARKADEAIAAEWEKFHAVNDLIKAARQELRSAEKMVRYYGPNHRQAEYYNGKVAKLQAKIEELTAQAAPLAEAARQLDAKLYKGWSRFFLVEHIHSSQHCSSFRPTTRIGWLPSVSGLTEAEAVKEHGATLCTICFPSAPTELTTKQQAADICEGTGTFLDRSLPHRTGFYSGNYGTCKSCGEVVTLTSGMKLRKHKNPNF